MDSYVTTPAASPSQYYQMLMKAVSEMKELAETIQWNRLIIRDIADLKTLGIEEVKQPSPDKLFGDIFGLPVDIKPDLQKTTIKQDANGKWYVATVYAALVKIRDGKIVDQEFITSR